MMNQYPTIDQVMNALESGSYPTAYMTMLIQAYKQLKLRYDRETKTMHMTIKQNISANESLVEQNTELRGQLKDVLLKDRGKTNEINIVTKEVRALHAQLDAMKAIAKHSLLNMGHCDGCNAISRMVE